MYNDLLEKQMNTEQKYAEEKMNQEKLMQEKMVEYETKIALIKSRVTIIKFPIRSQPFFIDEYMVEMENAKLDHDQEILRLKTQFQQATSKSKNSSLIFSLS